MGAEGEILAYSCVHDVDGWRHPRQEDVYPDASHNPGSLGAATEERTSYNVALPTLLGLCACTSVSFLKWGLYLRTPRRRSLDGGALGM